MHFLFNDLALLELNTQVVAFIIMNLRQYPSNVLVRVDIYAMLENLSRVHVLKVIEMKYRL